MLYLLALFYIIIIELDQVDGVKWHDAVFAVLHRRCIT